MIYLKIFIIRLFDALLMTIETIQIVKGKRKMGSIISFIEVLIWFLIIKEALSKHNSILVALFYALGYSLGTYFGSYLSQKHSKDKIMIQIITRNETIKEELINNKIPFSLIKSEGALEKNFIFIIVINNKSLNKLEKIILNKDKNAFISTYESKKIINGYFH